MNLNKIQEAVGQWSYSNFGDQGGIHHHAPLQGIVEEFGELYSAVLSDDTIQIKDAAADIIIYMFDYTYRRGILVDDFWSEFETDTNPEDIIILLGDMCHINLKNHQKIRDYADDNLTKVELSQCFNRIVEILNSYCDLEEAVRETWDKIVSKRNWKENPENG